MTDLLEPDGPTAQAPAAQPPAARAATDPEESRVAAAALSVPGVTRLTGSLGGLARAVHIEERPDATALPHRHVRVEVAVDTDHRAVEVARRVRTAARDALDDHPTVAVLITAVG